jgi:ParB family transcriptional regulator, chromosome partitioning protein
MGKGSRNSIDVYGASGKTNLLTFDPDKLKLITNKKHFLYDPRVENALEETLIASVKFRGVVEPIIVWKDPETGDTCVVDGRQRVKAAREANKLLKKEGKPIKLVKAIVERGDPKALMGVMVIANEGRTAVSALERAHLAQRLLEQGYTEDIVAVLLHVSSSGLKNHLALLDCTSDVKNAVEKQLLPATQAYKLSKLEPKKQRATLAKMLKAADGVKGKHARAKKMRQVNGNSHRTWTEIVAMRETIDSRDDEEARNWLSALDWVLGKTDQYPGALDEDEVEDERDDDEEDAVEG